eukprot:2093628-Amphidinium_carterae.1
MHNLVATTSEPKTISETYFHHPFTDSRMALFSLFGTDSITSILLPHVWSLTFPASKVFNQEHSQALA